MTFFQEVMTLRRRASEFAGVWTSIGDTVYTDNGLWIARLNTPTTAEFIVSMHNTWLILANAWLMTLRALKDRRLVTNAEKKDR